MPGFEIIDSKEFLRLKKIFQSEKVFFRYGFENIRKNQFFVETFENDFAKKVKSKYALGVTSGSVALKVALKTLRLKRGAKVLIPSFTFIATLEAILENDLQPVICDIDMSLNLGTEHLKKYLIKNNIKAVIVVHMLGYPANIKNILTLCKKKKIPVIEDTAWGLGGKIEKKYLGTFGRMGTFSFDYAKSITTGEGGMIVFNKKSDYVFAKEYHDHGHKNKKNIPRYKDGRNHPGFNYRMSEIQGAIGIEQLKKLNKIIKYQVTLANMFKERLKHEKIEFFTHPKNSFPTYDAFCFLVDSRSRAIKIRKNLIKKNYATKILPEASSWHFAGEWEHIENINKKNLTKSKVILDRTVALPLSMKSKEKNVDEISQIIIEAMSGK
mgnify:CR=1 FL=1|tara:strand:+ start:67 stop:1212 length:1146 start_codon:yes stop_codon:yes gene_type:complete